MAKTRLFKSNRSQAVRLPKEVAFPDDVKEVVIIRDGRPRIIAPAGSTWDEFFASPGVDIEEPEDLPVPDRDPL